MRVTGWILPLYLVAKTLNNSHQNLYRVKSSHNLINVCRLDLVHLLYTITGNIQDTVQCIKIDKERNRNSTVHNN
jgi:hypothetical protein